MRQGNFNTSFLPPEGSVLDLFLQWLPSNASLTECVEYLPEVGKRYIVLSLEVVEESSGRDHGEHPDIWQRRAETILDDGHSQALCVKSRQVDRQKVEKPSRAHVSLVKIMSILN